MIRLKKEERRLFLLVFRIKKLKDNFRLIETGFLCHQVGEKIGNTKLYLVGVVEKLKRY